MGGEDNRSPKKAASTGSIAVLLIGTACNSLLDIDEGLPAIDMGRSAGGSGAAASASGGNGPEGHGGAPGGNSGDGDVGGVGGKESGPGGHDGGSGGSATGGGSDGCGNGVCGDAESAAGCPEDCAVAAIYAGYSQSCARLNDGGLRCWGENSHNQLGNAAANPNTNVPVEMAMVSDAVTASLGFDGTCVITASADVRCWGKVHVSGPSLDPSTSVGNVVDPTHLALGKHHACAVQQDGAVVCWGRDHEGQLGNGAGVAVDVFSAVPTVGLPPASAVGIASGSFHSCARMQSGAVYCWGRNAAGQLDDTPSADRHTPGIVPTLPSIDALSAGSEGSCARAATDAHCWGTASGNAIALATQGIAADGKIATGSGFACAIASDQTVKCWGAGNAGQLGNGGNGDSPDVAQTVRSLTGVVDVAAGTSHACALTASGAVSCWGTNVAGELGDGSYTGSNVPVGVTGL